MNEMKDGTAIFENFTILDEDGNKFFLKHIDNRIERLIEKKTKNNREGRVACV